ncbi:MAG: DUF262 domain-containing protein [Bacteroidales bacterium]|nr:DUF262 domain-containing protein [Bacteroidales bacterium]
MSNNKEIGKPKTFKQLLEEENSIIIPKVQRDYAYGRKEQKVEGVLEGMLNSILEAVRDDNSVILDFVYGGSYVKKNKIAAGLIPLDGQQRLTTLFLLHFYASIIGDRDGNPISDDEVTMLSKFRYETRQSATEFCTNLVSDIRKNIIAVYKPENQNLKDLIVDNALYLSTYDSDPTIISMLNVLDKIEKKCKELNITDLTPCLWRRLMDRINIQFYTLSLENFGLTDDLFIKMNARGKKLTSFEIEKSDMVASIKKVSEELKDEFSKKMDTEWIDMAWDYTDKTINEKRKALDITNETDTKYSSLFANVFRLEYYRKDLQSKGCEEPTIENVLSDEEGIKSVMDILDTLHSIHKNGGFDDLWNKYFYFSDDIIGEDNKIRLFWKQKRCSVFELALNGALSVPEMVYLYSGYLLYKKKYDEEATKCCFRIIHNLMTGNVRAKDARTDKLPGFLKEVEYVIENKGIHTECDKDKVLTINGINHKLSFISNVWNEEYVKLNCLSNVYESLMRYENHDILRCSLSLFMDYASGGYDFVSNPSAINASTLKHLLEKFEKIFDNNYPSQFDNIRTLFLDENTDYLQYDPNMDKNDRSRRRYFLTSKERLSDFFVKTNNRKEQINILKILNKVAGPDDLADIENSYKRFKIDQWQYYHAKYKSRCFREGTRYGIGVWDDYDAFPLDLAMLNSSQHSEANLEWRMMTHILWTMYDDHNKYRLDDHGCSLMVLTEYNSAIGFKEGKWVVETKQDIMSHITSEYPKWSIEKDDNQKFIIGLTEDDQSMDYIELGQKIISIIESLSLNKIQIISKE